MARHNLRTVISFEVGRTLSRRWFWIVTLIVPATPTVPPDAPATTPTIVSRPFAATVMSF